MNPERWQRVTRLLSEVIAIESGKRSSFLDRACDGDTDLRHEVDSLLSSHEHASTGFLKTPAIDLKATVSPSLLSREGRRIGVYRIVEEIGHGGMGEVYRAVRADGLYTKEVAIKLVRGGFDSRFVLERFRNERQILASLDHPNIARLLDGGTIDDGVPYLVMELIEGKPIDKYCDEYKLSVTERLRLFRQVCVAVHYAHQRLVIHRDIKPSNVLVTKEGEPKLLDFGIAKIVSPIGDAQTTLTQAMTPAYASPEQIRGELITTATDVYSLGVVLYQLLTGHSPYPGATISPHKLAQAVCETEPERPSTVVVKRDLVTNGRENTPEQISNTREGSPGKLRRRLAGDLDDILLMALRKEATRRYGSVEQFAEDIRRHLAGLPVIASKGSWRYRAEKFVQRHKVGIAAAAVVILAVAGGVGATIREARIARAQGLRAENRFNDVRHLANSLIFDVDNSIANLPGTTSARKMLVDDALQYLDTLAKEAKGDATLQRELAAAYQKLGDVQGNPFRPNLGDTGAALESYRKALALRQTLASTNPGNKDNQVDLAFSYQSLGIFALTTSGNLQEALADETKAAAILEPLAQADPDNLNVLEKLRLVYESTANIQAGNGLSANLGDVDSALVNHHKALAIAERTLRVKPNDPPTRFSTALLHTDIGEDLLKQGNRRSALERYRNALDILKSLSAGSANTTYTRTIEVVYQRIGAAMLTDGDVTGGINSFRAGSEIAKKLAADDPRNTLASVDVGTTWALLGIALAQSPDKNEGLVLLQRAIDLMEQGVARNPKFSMGRRLLGVAYLFRGETLFKSGKLDGALSDFKKTGAIYETILAAGAQDTDARVQLSAVNSKIADVLVRRGDSSIAIDIYQKTLAVVEPLAHSTHPLLQAQYTAADTYSGLGAALQKQASHNGFSIRQRNEALQQACSWFEQSSAEWKRVPNPGMFSPDGFDTLGPSRVAQQLSSCEAQLRKHQERTQVGRDLNR